MQAASDKLIPYIQKTAGDPELRLFGKHVLPYPRDADEYWWCVLMASKPFRSTYAKDGGEQPAISMPSENKSQTPREECLLLKGQLSRDEWDVDWMFDESAPEKELTMVQIEPTGNFLDKSVYKPKLILQWKFIDYVIEHLLVAHLSEVPQFLGYHLNVFGNRAAKCVRMQHKVELRSTPANLLTIDKKRLEAPVDIHGKVFVVAQGRDITPEEIFEMVIFCMGQAETTELKLRSWEKLKEALQEEARKFLMNAQYVRPRPTLQSRSE